MDATGAIALYGAEFELATVAKFGLSTAPMQTLPLFFHSHWELFSRGSRSFGPIFWFLANPVGSVATLAMSGPLSLDIVGIGVLNLVLSMFRRPPCFLVLHLFVASDKIMFRHAGVSGLLLLLLTAFTLTAQAVDIVMSRVLNNPFGWRAPLVQFCSNIPPGKCCNNLFSYKSVTFRGLLDYDMAMTFQRSFESLSLRLAMQAWRPGDSPIKSYGCGGTTLDAGFRNAGGYRISDWGGSWNYIATGAMWINCADNPRDQLDRAFGRPRRHKPGRNTFLAMSKMVNGVCAVPTRRDIDGTIPTIDKTIDDASAPANNATDLDLTQDLDSAGWVYPDLLVYDGTNFTETGPGQMTYADAEGNVLNLTDFDQ